MWAREVGEMGGIWGGKEDERVMGKRISETGDMERLREKWLCT